MQRMKDWLKTRLRKALGIPELEEQLQQVSKSLPLLEEQLQQVNKSVPVLEEQIQQVNRALPTVEEQLQQVNKSVPVLEEQIQQVNRALPTVEEQLQLVSRSLEEQLQQASRSLEEQLQQASHSWEGQLQLASRSLEDQIQQASRSLEDQIQQINHSLEEQLLPISRSYEIIQWSLAERLNIVKGFLEPLPQDSMSEPLLFDPTKEPPPAYTLSRAIEVYGQAFRKAVEYISGVGIGKDSILEFGTYRGYTARLMASLIREFNLPCRLYLFDSFEGFPEIDSSVDLQSYEVALNKVWFKGQANVETGTENLIKKALEKILPESQLTLVKGFFEDTLETSLSTCEKASIIHIDCDLYSSAKYVLDKVIEKDLIQDGCVILFDDFNCNRANPDQGERRALAETLGSKDSRFTYSEFFSYGWHGKAFFVHEKS